MERNCFKLEFSLLKNDLIVSKLQINNKLMTRKKSLGQFYTTNYEYILAHLSIPQGVCVIEPFAGQGDLVPFIKAARPKSIELYDLEPKAAGIVKRNTLLEPPSYQEKFVVTNPPYLARNKSGEKAIYDLYGMNDLYKCFMKQLIDDRPAGGILIIPLNFFSSIREADVSLRRDFLGAFDIVHLNIFEEQVFDDTSCTVVSFQFTESTETGSKAVPVLVHPCKKKFSVELTDANRYTFGGEIYGLPVNDTYTITRITSKNLQKPQTNILVKCIDDNQTNQISFSVVDDDSIYVDRTPNMSARTYATLIIEPSLSIEEQEALTERCNELLNEYRERYHSLFLTNYRESKDIARKRISFDLVYRIVGNALVNNHHA